VPPGPRRRPPNWPTSARTTTSLSPQAGTLLYTLTRAIRPETIIEFGTSYGISTLYLAAARANLDQAGVGDAVTMSGRLRGLAHAAS
jgi:cephalosporin hydroxylase